MRVARQISLLGLVLLVGCASVPFDTALAPPAGDYFFQDVAISPDGRRIAFSRYSGGGDYDRTRWAVFVAEADGSHARLVSENAIWVSWSPDGRRLVFSSQRTGNADLYTARVDGTDLQRLTSEPSKESAPAWSPSGDAIAFTSDRDGNSEIYVLDLSSGISRRVTRDPADDYNPAWSPDGRTLVFYRASGGGGADQLFTISSDGSGETRLTEDGDLNTFPAFRHDGCVTFSKRFAATNAARIAVLDPATGETTLHGAEGAFFARWSPEGRHMLFIAGNWPKAAVYRMDTRTGRTTKILN